MSQSQDATPSDLIARMLQARQEVLQHVAQIAGDVMEHARFAEKSLYNVNSVEAKVLRAGMAGAAIAAAEQLGQGVFQAVLKRIEGIVSSFVLKEAYALERAILEKRLDALEKRLVVVEAPERL